MGVSIQTANYLVRRWFMDELGRVPSGADQATHARVCVEKGADVAFAGIYDSAEAKAYRTKVGRKV